MMKKPTTAAEAYRLALQAELKRLMAGDLDLRQATHELRTAEAMDAAAKGFLSREKPTERGTGGELVPTNEVELWGHAEAVRRPDYVAVEASIDRVQLADQCGAFHLAFDAAETIEAKDATEQMLAHQMAAAHKMALDLLAQSADQRDTVEQARLANSAARLMDTYQRGMLVFHRIRSGGKQTVTVQHVQVGQGGQAVVAGAVNTGGHSKSEESEK